MPDDPDFADLSKLRKKKEIPPYPFAGIVGQQAMKKALLLITVNPKIGSLLISGENGIGKMTAAMALAKLLPTMEVSEECVSNCDVRDHKRLCIDCSGKSKLESRTINTPFVRLPIGTSEHRIFGGFEKDGTFIPGILAMVNRGYLVMDRANLHDQELLTSILNIRSEGVFVKKEAESVYEHPAEFSLIATANPADHEFDDEMLSRFCLVVHAASIRDVEERIEIVRRVESYKEDPLEFLQRSAREENALRDLIGKARDLLSRAEVPKKTMKIIDTVMKEASIDEKGVKGNLVEAAKANAVLEDRYWATVEDVSEVVDIVVGHRQSD